MDVRLMTAAMLALALSAAPLVATDAHAQRVPEQLTHQGRLLDEAGQPLTGTVEVVYTLYDAPAAGNVLWAQVHSVEPDAGGFYSVVLGSAQSPLTPHLVGGGERWMGIAVNGTNLLPRVSFKAVPFALIAAEADVAKSVEDGAVTSAALSSDFALTPDQIAGDTLGGLSCATGDLARFDGTQWSCETTEHFVVSGTLEVAEDVQIAGQLQAESVSAVSNFYEDALLNSYPLGVSWQVGRGTNAPTSSRCRYGIVQTMYFSNCRARQVCFERDDSVYTRYLASHCDAAGPWGDWTLAGP